MNFFKRTFLQGLITQRLIIKTFFLATFFTSVEKHDTDNFSIEIEKDGIEMAAYVSPLRDGKVVENEGYTTENFRPPYVHEKKFTTAGHLLNDKAAGQTIYDKSSPKERASKKVAKDLDDLDRRLLRREEYQASEAILYGKVTVTDDTKDWIVDFNRNPDHTVAFTGTETWDDVNSDPIEQLKEYIELVEDNGGLVPDVIVMGADAVSAFRKHPKVIQYFNTINYKVGEFAPTIDKTKGVSQLFVLKELGVDVVSYNAKFKDPNTGEKKSLMPKNGVLIGCTDAKNIMHYGVIQDIEAAEGEKHVTDRYVDSYMTTARPKKRIVSVQSAPLACNHQPDCFAFLEVILPKV